MSAASERRELRLEVEGPFHLEATVRLLQRRPINRVDRFESGHYLRLFDLGGDLTLAVVENRGSVDAPDLRATLVGPGAERHIGAIEDALVRILGLRLDPNAMDKLAAREPRLAKLGRALRGMRPPRFPTLFETVANVIPFQQVSLDSGAAIVARIVERLGASADVGGRTFWAFPRAENVADAGPAPLREAGLSQAKAENLHRLAVRIARGELDERSLLAEPTEVARERLIELRGLGPWSAGLVLLRGLGRMDAFPAGDVGVARGLAALLGETRAFDPVRFAEPFGRLRGLVYFASLGAQLLERGLIAEPAS